MKTFIYDTVRGHYVSERDKAIATYTSFKRT